MSTYVGDYAGSGQVCVQGCYISAAHSDKGATIRISLVVPAHVSWQLESVKPVTPCNCVAASLAHTSAGAARVVLL